MDKDRTHMTERILNLTLEIIYLLTGEGYKVVKKTSRECEKPSSRSRLSGGLSRAQSPITVPPTYSLINERHNDQKILELTNKIIQLLTGEEGEYLEEHRGLYKDVMMENHRTLTSLDGPSNRDTPERCPRPLYSQDCTEENHRIPQEDQGVDMTVIKVEEIEEEVTYVRGDHHCKEEEIPTDISTDGETSRKTLEGDLIVSTNFQIEDKNIRQDSPGENPIALNFYPALYSADISSGSSNHEKHSPDNSDLALQSTAPKGEAILTISESGKTYMHQSVFVRHKRTRSSEKPFPCSECGKCFTHNSYLVAHQRSHTGEKPFTCPECGKCFAHKSHLVTHQRTHSSEKPFTCTDCGKCFTRKANVITHQRSHTGEKPFLCCVCGKCFTYKSVLVTHQRSHTGEKPFPCSECGKCFTRKSTLAEHERTHTGETPFPCPVCGKCFTYKSHLLRHQILHRRNTISVS
ncbi:oocyte zinc finger protein XlCOF8.4-like isoform X3 [Pseudophryne corroboree]|uniref:oocyte zinc finger protein XlCOF8.4-like isoform X3 n=1 Tax=Pseudophryne corroboree TaxID=495146 RepID=UPI003081E610